MLSGEVRGERREFVYEGAFDQTVGGNASFIPRLWATRKIGHLLTQIRLHGEKEEWVDAVVDLSVEYGIVTPYTSFLIEEDDILTDAGRERAAEQLRSAPTAPASGAPAVEMAEQEQKLRSADSAAPSGGAQSEGADGEAVRTVRHAGAKTFVLKRGVWIDTAFNPETMTTGRIRFGSETYFEFLAARPAWGDYLALGERVIFVVDEGDGPTAYEIVAEGEGTAEGPATAAPGTAIPGTEIPASPMPTGGAPGEAPDDPDEVEPLEPTATPDGDRPPTRSGGLCPGAMAMAAVAMAAFVVWETGQR